MASVPNRPHSHLRNFLLKVESRIPFIITTPGITFLPSQNLLHVEKIIFIDVVHTTARIKNPRKRESAFESSLVKITI